MALHLSILVLLIILSYFFENKIRTEKVAAALSESGDYHFKSDLAPWLIFFCVLTFLSYARTDTNDTLVYRSMFNSLEPSWENITAILNDDSKEKLFNIFQNIFKMYISTDYHMWFLFFAAIDSAILIHVLRKEAVSFSDATFFFFASTLYFNYFSMMRQWFAVCLVFAGITYLKRDKFVPFLLLCLFAAQFHSSAYIMIAVYFLVRGVAWGRKQTGIIFAFALAMLFLQPVLESLENSGGTYDYVVTAMSGNNGASIIRPIIAIVPVVLAYMYRDKVRANDRVMNICINMSLINFMLNFLAVFTSALYIVRLSMYMNIYNVILYPYLLNVALKNDKNQGIIKMVFYIMYFALYMYEMNNSGAFPYYSNIIGLFL